MVASRRTLGSIACRDRRRADENVDPWTSGIGRHLHQPLTAPPGFRGNPTSDQQDDWRRCRTVRRRSENCRRPTMTNLCVAEEARSSVVSRVAVRRPGGEGAAEGHGSSSHSVFLFDWPSGPPDLPSGFVALLNRRPVASRPRAAPRSGRSLRSRQSGPARLARAGSPACAQTHSARSGHPGP